MRAGRKSKLTPELIDKATKLIAAGNYVGTVCNYLGIGETTWYRWMSEGEKATRGRYREFRDAIKRAESAAEMRAVNGIVQAGSKNWQALAWYLERKHPDRWGRREQMNLEGNIGIKFVDDIGSDEDETG
ncbi:hypothetical protein [Desmospora activa]|uniref:Uncharacterized protein n=1 Tax=Desmospora activa DSM 45169 TaxID=1121389 RepID=A0A2T4Z919_9BACL|nr:hypothetical protein [Desmospora activa]PTM58370.1 hypothetical protein C8J48_0952 [Desmospora activa DSM 45169]